MVINQSVEAGKGLEAPTIADLLRTRAVKQPTRVGYVYLADGETVEQPMTYAAGDAAARRVAEALRYAGVRPGDRALLVLPPGLEYVTALFGCLYAGVIAVPLYPPDPGQPRRALGRLASIVRDCSPAAAITTDSVLALLEQPLSALAAMRIITVDRLGALTSNEGLPDHGHEGRPDDTTILQYTSGSTSEPRGVMLTNANLIHNSAFIHRVFRTGPTSRALVWLPPYHDMGLIGGLLQPLYGGFPVTLMSPLHFLQEPMRWLRAISRHRATASGGPNFAYDLCARRCSPADLAELDLSSWAVAFNGAEPVQPQTLERFSRTFGPAGFSAGAFLPCYGLAEATLIVSGTGGRDSRSPGSNSGPRPIQMDRSRLEEHEAVPTTGSAADRSTARLIGCGFGSPDQRLVLVDPHTRILCEPGRIGEIWIAGPSVAPGYWGRPQENQHTFGAHLADGTGPFLRSGDLGFWHNGELVVTGRLTDLVIVRGRNHYPHDLERTAEAADPSLRPGSSAAFTLKQRDYDDDTSGGDLTIVLEVRRRSPNLDVAAVTGRVRESVARDHGLFVQSVVLVEPGQLPKTSSGKVQRRLCRRRLASGELREIGRNVVTERPDQQTNTTSEAASGAGGTEAQLRHELAAALGVDPSGLDRNTPLVALGLDSLATIRLQHVLAQESGLSIPLRRVLSGATLAELAADVTSITADRTDHPDAFAPTGATTQLRQRGAEFAPMSYGQRWIWFLQHAEPANPAFGIALALRLPGPLDERALRRSLDLLVTRHAVLRTTFPLRDGVPVQRISPTGSAAYGSHDAHEIDDTTLRQVLTRASARPFDLQAGPLFRADLYRGVGDPVLLIAVHHIIMDFWSSSIIMREFAAIYRAYIDDREPDLSAQAATFADFVVAQRSRFGGEQVTKQETYWEGVVGEGLPRLRLTSPQDPSGLGGSIEFSLSDSLARRVADQAAQQQVTPYVVLLAAFATTLLAVSGDRTVALGTNAAARTSPEFAGVVGLCTNPLLLRAGADPDETFLNLLLRTRDGVLSALEHQDYPVMLLAARMKARLGRLFDALFAYNRSSDDGDALAASAMAGPSGTVTRLGALEVERLALPLGPGGLPVELVISEVDKQLYGVLRYRGDALDAAGAQRLVDHFLRICATVADEPECRMRTLGVTGDQIG